jgi:hypothetical protein
MKDGGGLLAAILFLWAADTACTLASPDFIDSSGCLGVVT